MSAFEWFEGLRAEGERIRRIEQDIAFLESSIAPHGQGFEPMGHGSSTDPMVRMSILSARLGELRGLLPDLERRHKERLERATSVLYGKSGRGGVAKAVGTDEADMLCFHYCQGESWASVGRRFEPDTPNLTMWCKRKAERVCKQVDRIGMEALADS